MGEKGSPPKAEGDVALEAIAEQPLGELRDSVPGELRAISFPVAMRGCSRHAVDAYVERVNRVIAELEVSRSPRSAVRHALEQVTEQVDAILERARGAADEITGDARQEAEETMARAKAEAADLVVEAGTQAERTRVEAEGVLAKANAEAEEIAARAKTEGDGIVARARDEAAEERARLEADLGALRERAEAELQALHADTEALGEERNVLLSHIRGMAARLEELAGEAASRFPSHEPAQDGDATAAVNVEAGDDEPTAEKTA